MSYLHQMDICREHGLVISQCRCARAHKTMIEVDCSPACPGYIPNLIPTDAPFTIPDDYTPAPAPAPAEEPTVTAEIVMPDYPANYTWDFNRPVQRGVSLRADDPSRVGSLLRLVDLDPTGGFLLVRIMEIELTGLHRRAKVEEIRYTPWVTDDGRVA